MACRHSVTASSRRAAEVEADCSDRYIDTCAESTVGAPGTDAIGASGANEFAHGQGTPPGTARQSRWKRLGNEDLQEVVEHVQGDDAPGSGLTGGGVHDEPASQRYADERGFIDVEVVQDRRDR